MKSKQKTAATTETQANAIALLKADHRKVNSLFTRYESAASPDDKSRLVKEICTELIVHTRLEEELFYPACREADVGADALDEAQVEHDGAKLLINSLLQATPDSPFYDAQLSVLREYIKHHVGEEENPGSGIFAKARAAKLDMKTLGERLQKRKEELMAQAEKGDLGTSEVRAIDPGSIIGVTQEKSIMARQYERERDNQGRFSGDDGNRGGRGYSSQSSYRERDEQGRFASDDDDYRQSSRGSSGGGGRASSQSSYRERDEQGRFMSEDEDYGSSSRGYSGGDRGRSGEYESQGRNDGRSGSSREDYEDGRSGARSSQGNWESRSGSRSSRSDEDDRYSRGSSGERGRGWFGDSEGHARASEEGWENRRGGGGGRSGSDENERQGRGSSDERGRGWFGDSEGHSRASEEGWENRRGGGGGRSGSDENERQGRGSSDDRGSSGSRGSSSGRSSSGEGGWFGDPRGHAEAARRGWQNR